MIFLNIHTHTKDNQHTHWRSKARTTKVERDAAFWAVKALKDRPPFPVRVTLTRCGPRKLDVCNMGSAMKAIVDGIADAYGVDDGDDRWQWEFRQRKQSLYGVEITIEPGEDQQRPLSGQSHPLRGRVPQERKESNRRRAGLGRSLIMPSPQEAVMSQPEQGELFAAEDEQQAEDGVLLVSVQSICPRCRKPGAYCEVEKHLERRSAPRKFCQRCKVVVNALGPGAEAW